MPHNVSVAPNRNNYVHLAGIGCTHLLTLYLLMVFIHETHVLPSSGKEKTKRHMFQEVSAAQFVSCSKQEQITTLHTFGLYWLHPSSGIILIDGVYS